MDALASTDICLFESFRLDRRGGALSRRDERGAYVSVAIGSRALDILGVLVERAGELCSRAEIIDAVWPGTAVEDSNLNVQIAALRRVLDQGREGSSCIQTVPGRGYRFTAPVTRDYPAIAENAGASRKNDRVPVGAASPGRQRFRWLRGGIMVAAIGALVTIAAFATWYWQAPSSGELRSAPRLSIVVLPFTNLSDDREQQYFADGFTDDLTTDLSRVANMFVISHNTAFTYKDKIVSAKQVGHELGIRYVLKGSVRRSANQIRVNSQLIDAGTNA